MVFSRCSQDLGLNDSSEILCGDHMHHQRESLAARLGRYMLWFRNISTLFSLKSQPLVSRIFRAWHFRRQYHGLPLVETPQPTWSISKTGRAFRNLHLDFVPRHAAFSPPLSWTSHSWQIHMQRGDIQKDSFDLLMFVKLWYIAATGTWRYVRPIKGILQQSISARVAYFLTLTNAVVDAWPPRSSTGRIICTKILQPCSPSGFTRSENGPASSPDEERSQSLTSLPVVTWLPRFSRPWSGYLPRVLPPRSHSRTLPPPGYSHYTRRYRARWRTNSKNKSRLPQHSILTSDYYSLASWLI